MGKVHRKLDNRNTAHLGDKGDRRQGKKHIPGRSVSLPPSAILHVATVKKSTPFRTKYLGQVPPRFVKVFRSCHSESNQHLSSMFQSEKSKGGEERKALKRIHVARATSPTPRSAKFPTN